MSICTLADDNKTYSIGIGIIAVVASYKLGYITKEDLDTALYALGAGGLMALRQGVQKVKVAVENSKEEVVNETK